MSTIKYYIKRMNTLDIVLLIIYVLAIFAGIRKGFVAQTVGLASIFISAYCAYLFADKVSKWLAQWIHVSPQALYIISFIIVIILAVALLNLGANVLTNLLKNLTLGWLNSVLGVVMAMINTTLILGVIFMVFNSFNTTLFHFDTPASNDSVVYQFIRKVCETVFPAIQNFFTNLSNGGASC